MNSMTNHITISQFKLTCLRTEVESYRIINSQSVHIPLKLTTVKVSLGQIHKPKISKSLKQGTENLATKSVHKPFLPKPHLAESKIIKLISGLTRTIKLIVGKAICYPEWALQNKPYFRKII